jgi:hypothetical protein
MGVKNFQDFECKDKRTIGGICEQRIETFISMEYVRFVGPAETLCCSFMQLVMQ